MDTQARDESVDPSVKAPDAFRTISEVAADLDLPQHVLRFWETRFSQIKPMKRGGGRRYYRPEDIDLLRGIRFLLYAEGFTIRGVQRLLREKGLSFVARVGQTRSMEKASAAEEVFAQDEQTEQADADEAQFAGEDLADIDEADVEASEPEAQPYEAVPAGPDRELPPSMITTVVAGLSKESRRKLELALSELMEAKRLLDQPR